ncbi:S8 family serine peptidase [Modestobacter lapidis]|nr:S8 family serine peptidase [Modestobacter lapidis]
MHRGTSLSGSGVVLTLLAALAVTVAPPAAAADGETTVDVLRVVDGEYAVETVVVPVRSAAATAAGLADDPGVVAASPQVTYRVDGTTDPYWRDTDPGGASSVTSVWPRTRGAGQLVAVLDTAAAFTHPDLVHAALPGTDIARGPGEPWHGVGVAGVVAAQADNGIGGAGMAPDAKVMPVRVCDDGGCASGDVARGVLWAVDRGADVINMSLSGAGYSDVQAAAVQYALDKGISVVASAGNDGLNGNPVMYPAALSGVIGVSATTQAGAPADWAVHGWQVDVSTVGDSILTSSPPDSYANATGTSFSGPAVAGAVALLRSGHPGIEPAAVQAALQAGAESSSWDRTYGAGRLDVPAAFAAADRSSAPITVTPGAGQIDVSWDAVPGATGYTVRVDGTVRATGSATSARVTGLTDGNQVAVDVQADGGDRGRPVLATVGGATPATPVLDSAALRGTSSSALLELVASVDGAVSPRYDIIRNGVSIGSTALALTSTPATFSIGIGAMPTVEARWQLRPQADLGRTATASNAVVTGSGRPAPPPAVTGLAAQDRDGEVLLTWDDQGTALTYRVSVAGAVVATPRTAGAVVPAPSPGQSRTYAVSAVDAWEQAGPAAAVEVGTAAATAPGAPTGVSAAPGNGSATVTWSAAPDNGSPVTQYTVAAAPGGATATTSGATTARVTGLSNGTPYTFTVTATNAAGTGPASSASAPVTPADVPGAPTAVVAVAHDAGATVSWTPGPDNGSAVRRYSVRSPERPGVVSTTTGTTLLVPGLTNGTPYTFVVRADNSVGTGPESAASTPVVPAGVPGAPTAVTATAGDGRATVTWSPAPANGTPVTGYTVTAQPGGRTATTTGATDATVTGLTNGTAHTFTVTAANAVGAGPASARSAAVTPVAPSAITRAHDALGGNAGRLGAPTTEERCGLRSNGCYRAFAHGSIYWTAATGAHAVTGTVLGRWASQGWEGGPLGYPVTGTECALVDGGCYQHFQGGTVMSSPATGAWPVTGVLRDGWFRTGSEGGVLGYPAAAAVCGLPDGGCLQRFAKGTLYSSPATGARAVLNPAADAWARQGWERGALGYPVTDTTCGLARSGCYQHFQGGTVMYSPASGSWAVTGVLRDAWFRTGSEGGALGYPASAPVCGLRDGGCFQRFERGALYWSSATGARAVVGPAGDGWARQGWEGGPLGYPVTDTTCGLKDGGCYQHFQGGTVMYSPASGSWAVTGTLRDRWFASGSEGGVLGYPVSAPVCGLRDGGCFQHFERGSIYWTSRTGPRVVAGAMLEAWRRHGWENSADLGYPVSEVNCTLVNGGCFQVFERGSLYSGGTGGPAVVSGVLRDRWAALGWERSFLGYPQSDASCGLAGGCAQTFQHGEITWSPATGAVALSYSLQLAWYEEGAWSGRLGWPVDARTGGGPTVPHWGRFQHGEVISQWGGANAGHSYQVTMY